MWFPRSIKTKPVTLNFTSSEQGFRDDTALIIDGVVLANAIRLSYWEDDRLQAEVCPDCGHVQCAPGGWVTVRRIGPYVLVIPTFDSMEDAEVEYSPPKAVAQRGPLALSEQQFSHLRSLIPSLPGSPPLLTAREAAQVLQFTAPGRVVGQFPATPLLPANSVLTSEPAGVSQAFNNALSEHYNSRVPAEFQHPVISSLVTFFLDLPGAPAWQPFSHEHTLVLGPGIGTSAA